jgi:hypothetical protein
MDFASNIMNKTAHSNRSVVVALPGSFPGAVNSLHFAFLVSVTTKRRLFVSKANFKLPRFLIARNMTPGRSFSSTSIRKCAFRSILESSESVIQLKGKFEVSDLLLSPNVFNRIPLPFRTHGVFLLGRWLMNSTALVFPGTELQIGIALEFQPDFSRFLDVVDRLAEGYRHFRLLIWSSRSWKLPKVLAARTLEISEFEEAMNILPHCDKFVGTLGSFHSHFLSRLRGRGGVFLDPRDSMIIETSNSQSGMLFEMKDTKIPDIMCPGGASALQAFVAFHAL